MIQVFLLQVGTLIFFALVTVAIANREDPLVDVTIPQEAIEREASYRPIGGMVKKLEYYLGEELVGERRYYEDGTLAEEKIYRDGKLHGYWRQNHANGRVFAERPHRNGLPDGTFRFFDEEGELLGESVLKEGSGQLREFPAYGMGSMDALIPYVNGQVHGTRLTWGRYANLPEDAGQEYVDGIGVTEFRHGQPNGWTAVYDEDGRLFRSGYMRNGRIHGVTRRFDTDGNILDGWPRYYLESREVPREEYLPAAEEDPLLKESLENDRPSHIPDLKRPESSP